MSKATRIRQQNARERIAAQRAAARRAEIRNRVLIVSGSVLAVIAIVVALVVVKISNNNSSGSSGSKSTTGTALPASVTSKITGVPASTLNSVGIGSILSYNGTPIGPVSGEPPLTSGGKPEMLYIGAEFCPYCAAERWAMAVALSRFGHFTTQLHGIHSSSSDTDPNTPTLTYLNAGYSSPYLTFTPVENEDINHNVLQTPTAAQQALWVKYDTTDGSQGYPFIDIGNKYVIKAPSYDPATLAGLTWAQVATDLQNPSSAVAKAADGTANLITAAICKVTGNQPSSVCTSAGVVQASAHL
jgi:thiol-disulfide isomerase/thioredoxin